MAEAAGVAVTGRLETEMVVTNTRAAGPTMRGGDTTGNTAVRGGTCPQKGRSLRAAATTAAVLGTG